MDYQLTKLENGLRVITVPMPNLESVTITVWTGVGSRYESAKVSGLSHFLEHIVFKGSKKRPSAKLISEAVDSFGGEFNASTSKEWTCFYIKARSEKLDIASDVLSDMVLNPLLKKEDVEREKGVILEEIAMYDDTPIAKIDDYFENLIYSGNSLARDIVGNRDSIKSMSEKDFVNYRNLHYGSNNMLITIAGGVKETKALDIVKKYFSSLGQKQKVKHSKFKTKQVKPKAKLHSRKIEQAHLILGFMGNPLGHSDRFAEALLSSILGGGMSSRLFLEVREKRGLAYAVRTSSDHNLDCGYLSTYAGVDIKRVEEAIKVILAEHYKLRDKINKISKKELNKAKEYLKGHLALSLEDTKDVNSFFGLKELLLGKIETPEEVFKELDKVTVEEIIAVAKKFFQSDRLNLAITGPFKDEKKFQDLLA